MAPLLDGVRKNLKFFEGKKGEKLKIAKLLLYLFGIAMIGGIVEVSLRSLIDVQLAKISYIFTIFGAIHATNKIMF